IARNLYLNSVPAGTLPPYAAAAAFDILVRFIKTALRTLLVVGLIVAAGAFFTGPSAAAAGTRSAFSSGLGRLRRGGESAGPAGAWTYAHRHGLRIGAVALAALSTHGRGDRLGVKVPRRARGRYLPGGV